MNSRFEPDSPKISTWIGQYFNNQEKMENCIEDKEKLKKFIQENIVESNFSTRLSDAHKNINCSYKIVDANEDLLKKKYLKGSSPNKLLDKKGMTQSKMSYNEGQLPIQLFPETKSSLIVNKGDFKKLNDIKEVQDEEIINDNIINDN